MPKSLGAGQNINIRFTDRLLARIDQKLAELQAGAPGASFTRSDVVRMAVEAYTAGGGETGRKSSETARLAKAGK